MQAGDFSLYGEENLLDVKSITLKKGESTTLNYEYDSFNYKYLKGELSKRRIYHAAISRQ